MPVCRAWLVGHRAVVGLGVVAALSVATVLFEKLRLEGIVSSAPFPAWGMFPPTIAAVTGTMCVSRLPVPRPGAGPMVVARCAWTLVLLGVVASSAAIVSATVGHWPLLHEALALTALTIGASCAVGRLCIGIGLAVDAAVATMGASSRFVGLGYWYVGLGTTSRTAIIVGAIACVALYAARGARAGSVEARLDA